MKFFALFLLANSAEANVYLHSPRGSNNRLNENSAENKNNERLFRSNNNRRGGYNVGDRTNNAFQDESGQYAMQYFQSGLSGDSYLTVEWTNLLGCGKDEDGDKIHNCEIVIQTNCQSDIEDPDAVPPADSYTLRNGKSTDQIPYDFDPDNVFDPQGHCFIDGHDRDMPHRMSNIPDNTESSIQFCLDQCKNAGYLYAGIQYTRECWCDNDFGKYGEAPLSECDKNCNDATGNKCGGGWRQNIFLASTNNPNTPALKLSEWDKLETDDNELLRNDDDYEGDDEYSDEEPVDLEHDAYGRVHFPTKEEFDLPKNIQEVAMIEETADESGSNSEDGGCQGGLKGLFDNFFSTFVPDFGLRRRTAAVGTREEKNDRRSATENSDYGLHEPWEHFDRCDATFGTRYGMECWAEREQWPDNNISPWVDVAYFTDEPESECSDSIENLNAREFYECVEYYDVAKQFRKHKSLYASELECIDNGGDWLGFYKVGDVRDDIGSSAECLELNGGLKEYVWGRPMSWKDLAEDKLSENTCIALPAKTECLGTPNTRRGYLGDVDGARSTPRFQWTLPNHEENKRCVFRIRYIVTTEDEEITRDDHRVYPFGTDGISLAPADKRVVFEDRSHVFKLLTRPEDIPDELHIHNLVVRGKRGNIVQTYPAVEYDFVPNRLTIPEGDAIHVQWTGSNTHNNGHPGGDGQTGDAGEGQGGTDRNNFIQLIDRKSNLVAPQHNHTLFQNADWIWSSHEMGNPENKAFNLALSMATSGYYQCKDDEECTESYDNTLNDQLNNAYPSYHGNIFKPIIGEYNYKCMRNDNFSNRAQKGTIFVERQY
jgi:plastocyanin